VLREPGEKLVPDITYLRIRDSRVYLTSLMDLHGRKVIGWALSGDMTAEQTTVPALAMACMNRRPKADLIFHSVKGRTVLLRIVQGQTERWVSGGQAEHEPEGKLPGQRLRGEFFQNVQEGAGNPGR
jgi:transposase InsO family protein